MDPWDDADPDDDCDPCVVGTPPPDCCPLDPPLAPAEPLLEPLLPLLCCDGNGDSLPLPDWVWLDVVLGLPLEDEGADDGDELGIVGIDGIDVCVDVVAEQPTSPSVPAMAQTMALT